MVKQAAKLPATSQYQAFFSRPGTKLAMGILALLLAYVFGSWAIDSGSLIDYAITVLLLLSAARDLYDVAHARAAGRKV